MFKIGDKVILTRDWTSEINKNVNPYYSAYKNKTFTVVKRSEEITFINDSNLDAAFTWRFDLYYTDLENK